MEIQVNANWQGLRTELYSTYKSDSMNSLLEVAICFLADHSLTKGRAYEYNIPIYKYTVSTSYWYF